MMGRQHSEHQFARISHEPFQLHLIQNGSLLLIHVQHDADARVAGTSASMQCNKTKGMGFASRSHPVAGGRRGSDPSSPFIACHIDAAAGPQSRTPAEAAAEGCCVCVDSVWPAGLRAVGSRYGRPGWSRPRIHPWSGGSRRRSPPFVGSAPSQRTLLHYFIPFPLLMRVAAAVARVASSPLIRDIELCYLHKWQLFIKALFASASFRFFQLILSHKILLNQPKSAQPNRA